MRAIFTGFDHFMAMFVAVIGVLGSTMFMPLLGGPLHRYETRAIGAGWQSLRTGKAANLNEAIEIATSLPAEVLLPSAHAEELPIPLASSSRQGAVLDLLGGPDATLAVPPRARRAIGRAEVISVSAMLMTPIGSLPEPVCDMPAMKSGVCEELLPAGSKRLPQAADLMAALPARRTARVDKRHRA